MTKKSNIYVNGDHILYGLERLKDNIIDYRSTDTSITPDPINLELVGIVKKYYDFAKENGIDINLLKARNNNPISLYDMIYGSNYLLPSDDNKIKELLLDVHNNILSSFRINRIDDRTREDKFEFFINDGTAKYGDLHYKFKKGKKGYELLKYLYNNISVKLSLQEIKAECNYNILVEKHRFRSEKDIDDTIIYIKKCLKVKKSEFFPIYKSKNGWTLAK